MKMIYAAQQNADTTEGRGPMVTFAYFTNEKSAKEAVKGRGVMGYGDGEVKVIPLYDSIEDWRKGEKEETKRRALAKLTPEEKASLGY